MTSTATRSNLGPLTTTFVYPSSCEVVVRQCEACEVGWQAQTCSDNGFNTQGVEDNYDCWPKRDNLEITTGVALLGWGYYSPGLECPVGYTTACSATGSAKGGFDFQFPLLKSETAVGCCPSGFDCRSGDAQTCVSVVTTGSFAAVMCSSGESNGYGYVDIPMTVVQVASSDTTKTVISTMSIFAPLFQLNFQSTDLPSSAVKTHSTEVHSSATSHPTEHSSSSSGLSTGAKAGIGAGVGAFALVLIGVAMFLFFKKRKTGLAAEGEKPPGGSYVTSPSELEAPTARSELP